MKIRLTGTKGEYAEAATRIVSVADVLEVRCPRASRDGSRLVRVYIEVRIEAGPATTASRAALRSELRRLRQAREAWDETARACACQRGRCLRRGFRDHAGESGPSGCMVCAELDPEQSCYAAVLRALRARDGKP